MEAHHHRRGYNPPRYSPRQNGEDHRLRVQARLFREWDLQLLDRGIKKLPAHSGFTALDIGCASGELARDMLSGLPGCNQIIGIDRDRESIDAAKRTAAEIPVAAAFFEVDLDAEDLEVRLREAIEPSNGAPCLIFAAFVLHMLPDPTRLLTALSDLAPNGSVVVIRTVDDALKISYPAEFTEHIARLEELRRLLPAHTDRYHGRKLHHQLRAAGFTNLDIVTQTYTSAHTRPQDMFDVFFSYKAHIWKRQHTREFLGERTALAVQEEVEQLLALIEQGLCNQECFLSYTTLGAIGSNQGG